MTRGQLPLFGALLKRHRVEAGLTQEELGARARLSARGISDLERSARRTPQSATVEQLAEALELSTDARIQFEAAARRLAYHFSPLLDSSSRIPARAGLDSGNVSRMPLIGRTRELAALERHLAGMGPPLLILAGEPGIGKSRLLREIIKQATDRGFVVLHGGCQQRSGEEAYAPLVKALARHIRRQSSSQLRSALRGCAWLVRLLPEVAEIVGEALPALAPQQERRLLFEAVSRFLANVTVPAGTLLVLDDLQWADSGALDLLTSLVQPGAESLLRVVGAYRDTEVQSDHPLSVALAGLGEHELATLLALQPLDPGDAMALLDGLLETDLPAAASDQIKQQIVQRAGGLPFFLVSCAHGLTTDGQSVPWNLAQSVRQRVAALPMGAREALQAAAMVGRVVPRSVLLAMVGSPEREVLAGLDAACRARLLVEASVRAYRFAHDVVREVIEEDLGAARRVSLHRDAARALEQLSEWHREQRTQEIAWHYLQGDQLERALPWTVRAGDRAEMVFAHDEAERQYHTALELAWELGNQSCEAEILVKLGNVLRIVGRYDEALQLLERAVPIYHRANDLEAGARTAAVIGRAHFHRGTYEQGIARIQSLLEPLEAAGPSHGLGALYAALVPLFAPTGRYREYLATAERAAELGRALGDDRILAEGEMWQGLALAHLTRTAEARQVLESAIPVAERVGDLYSLATALAFMGFTSIVQGDLAQARVFKERAVEASERLGDPGFMAWCATRLGDVFFLLGDWDQARACHERASGILRSLDGMPRHGAVPVVSLGELCLVEGGWDEAARFLQEGHDLAVRTQHLGALRAALVALTEKDLLEGQPERALARLHQPHPLLQRPELEETICTMLLPVRAWAHLEVGQVDEAGRLAGKGIEHAITHQNRIELPPWLRMQGMVFSRQGRWDEAERALDKAVTLAHSVSYPYEEARGLYACGRMLMEKGNVEHARLERSARVAPRAYPEPPLRGRDGGVIGEGADDVGVVRERPELADAARGRLESALAIFRQLGAQPYLHRTQQALRELHGT